MALVLVVDDVRDARDVLAAVLECGGHEVVMAGGGEEALRLLGEAHPDLMLLDVSMPGMSGFDVLRRMHDDPALDHHVPVFMMTAFADPETRRRAADLGAAGFFVKGNVDIDELLARVDAQVSGGGPPYVEHG